MISLLKKLFKKTFAYLLLFNFQKDRLERVRIHRKWNWNALLAAHDLSFRELGNDLLRPVSRNKKYRESCVLSRHISIRYHDRFIDQIGDPRRSSERNSFPHYTRLEQIVATECLVRRHHPMLLLPFRLLRPHPYLLVLQQFSTQC